MATQSKSQLLNDIHSSLKRRYKPSADRDSSRLSVLEAVVYGICHENTTREQANQALSRFSDEFFDWNEVRVSGVEEIEERLAGIPEPAVRAQKIRRFLRQLFNRTYGFTLDALTKRPLKEALKVLHTYDAFASDYVTATVVQQALGGHAIPIDKVSHRVLQRFGFSENDVPTLRGILERAVPKNRGAEFLDLLEELAFDTCLEAEPQCSRCELRKVCPYALSHKEGKTAPSAARSGSARGPKDAAKTAKSKGTDGAHPATAKRNVPPAKSTKESHPASRGARGKHGGAK
ncbi:MAG: endonuclease III domain-containing protein [Isosphaeraceae bacterium]